MPLGQRFDPVFLIPVEQFVLNGSPPSVTGLAWTIKNSLESSSLPIPIHGPTVITLNNHRPSAQGQDFIIIERQAIPFFRGCRLIFNPAACFKNIFLRFNAKVK